MENFLTSAQAASALEVTPARIRQMAREGRLKATGQAGATRLFSEKEVARVAAQRAERKAAPTRRGGR